MNLRRQKRYNLGRMAYNNWFGCGPLFSGAPAASTFTSMPVERKAALASLVESPAVEEAKQEFICVKVKDGTVVGTFDTVGEARELLEKYARQKKAKLQVMDTSTGELVLFEEA